MVVDHYLGILERSRLALAGLKNDSETLKLFTTAHNDADDLDQLEKLLDGRVEETMFKLARVEYQHALYSASFGQYRQAHVSLRLFFELSLCCILFSAHEIDMRLWVKDKKDSNWTSIMSKDNGVFSKHFVGAFFEEMQEHCEEYHALAEKLYRECSEFVHGNRQSYEGIDTGIAYNADVLSLWADRAETARRVVKFSYFCRYLKGAPMEIRHDLEELAREEFGELVAIQAVFEKEGQ